MSIFTRQVVTCYVHVYLHMIILFDARLHFLLLLTNNMNGGTRVSCYMRDAMDWSIYHITVWEIDAGGMAREGAGGGRRERERDHYKGKESECQVNWIL